MKKIFFNENYLLTRKEVFGWWFLLSINLIIFAFNFNKHEYVWYSILFGEIAICTALYCINKSSLLGFEKPTKKFEHTSLLFSFPFFLFSMFFSFVSPKEFEVGSIGRVIMWGVISIFIFFLLIGFCFHTRDKGREKRNQKALRNES